MGRQLHVRALTATGSRLTTFDAHDPGIDCLLSSGATDWVEFSERCRSENDGVVQIETNDYVPYLASKTDCGHGDPGCNRCVPDVVAALSSTLGPQAGAASQSMYLNVSTQASVYNHIQGMVRLPDVDVGGAWSGRIMVSRDGTELIGADPAHVFFFEQLTFVSTSTPFLDGSSGFLLQDIEVPSVSTHPGGLASAGDIVAVPMEREAGEIIFYGPNDGDPFSYTEVSRMTLGLQGELDQPNPDGQWAAGSVSLVQLISGRYLMFVGGRDHGRGPGWFYLSDRDRIDQFTTWKYLDTWYPDCAVDPGAAFPGNCWVGAENSVLFSQCDGQIYLVGMAAGTGDVPSYASVRLLQQTSGSPEIEAVHVATLVGDGPGAPGVGDASFRWGATMTAGPDGRVAVEMTERDIDGTGSNSLISIAKFRPL